ncbi:unnamed protein product [Cylindrotheca closterium]|uniref:Uncharacterized protein n=1 Tax=Cylindrotheca closterium TaxID=2856 RepID=A0AAD2FZM4_9STRA|nr:unnamed protein product [Cylindrotheca closterium]
MSDSDSSDDEGIPSIAALVNSLVPNAPGSDDDSDSDAGERADVVGKLPSSISNLVQSLVQQYDSISDDSDPGNSSSDDDDENNNKKNAPARVPVDDDDSDDDDDDEDDADLSNLVQNILNRRAHRDSVDVNSRLGPITMNIPKSSPKHSPKKVDIKKSSAKAPPKSTGLQDTMHSLPEHKAILSPLPSTPIRSKITPSGRQRQANGKSSPSETNSIQQTAQSLSLNESSHTIISAASTDSIFDAAELDDALGKGDFNDDDNSESSFAIPNGSISSSIGEFASSVSARDNSKQNRTKKRKSPKPSKSSSSKASKASKISKASKASKASSKDKSKSRRSKSSRRYKLEKQPLSPLLGKMVGDSAGGDEDDILSPLALQTPLKKKKKASKITKSKSERSDSRSKRSRSSLSRSSHKSVKKNSNAKEDRASPDRGHPRRSKENDIPETPSSKYDNSSRPQRTPRSAGLLSPPSKPDAIIPETPGSKTQQSSIRSAKKGSPSKVSSAKIKPKRRRSKRESIQKAPFTKPSKQNKEAKVVPTDDQRQPVANAHAMSPSDKESVVSPKQSNPKETNSRKADSPGQHNAVSPGQESNISSSRRADDDFVEYEEAEYEQPLHPSTPGQHNAVAPRQESNISCTRRADDEFVGYEEVEYEQPLHPSKPIHMISFTNEVGLLPLDGDTSISSSSTEEEDEYETESSEGEGGTEYGSEVSGSQIPHYSNHDSMQQDSTVPPSEAEYESDLVDDSNADNKDFGNAYEEYESDKSPAVGKFGNDYAGDSVAIDDDYESDDSDSFVEEEPIAEPAKRSGRRTMLQRAEKQSDLSLDGLDDYESDSDDSIEEPPKRTGRRALLERSVSSDDLTAVLDEYELDSDSDDGDNGDNSDSFVEEEPIAEPPKRSGRRTMLQRAEKQSDLSLDDYESDSEESESEEDLVEESPKRTGRRALLERSVSSDDLTAVLDEYELDSDSESGQNEDNEGSRDGSDDESDDEYEPNQKRKGARERQSRPVPGSNNRERESWPVPGSNPRKNLPLSDASSSVDYTDGSDSIGLDKQDYEASSDNEPTEQSKRYGVVNENDDDSDFNSDNEFDFEDYNVIGVSDESSDESDSYSAASGVDSVEDRNYYAKLDAVTRREDQLALRSQRLRRKVYLAVGIMFVMILALVILFIVDPLGKDVLIQEGSRRLRGRPKIQ